MSTSLPESASFEESLIELERLLRNLEDGSTGLEEALGDYERGVSLLKTCYGQLRQAEQRIVALSGVDDEGRPVVAPFQHDSTVSDPESAVQRRRGRSSDRAPPF